MLPAEHIDLHAIDFDAFLGEKDIYATRVHGALAVIQFHSCAP
jgi:hypothetical protein